MSKLCCAPCLWLMLVFPLPADEVPAPLQPGQAAGDLWEGNSLGMKFRWCPPGKFKMGSPENELDRYAFENQVNVTISKGFYLGQCEVTQAEWTRIMGTTVEQQRDKQDTTQTLNGAGSTHPMYYVSWEDAMEFCQKLTAQERAANRLPEGWEYTLPTEAQWEYACRAGTTTATAFGVGLDSTQANFDGNYPYIGSAKGDYKEQTTAVGSYQANAWNLYDMHGNVDEWCRDWCVAKLPGGIDPEVILTLAGRRVHRGGSWLSHGGACRSAMRRGGIPDHRCGWRGFRLALIQVR